MDLTCYFLENTPGVMDPQHDQFLGCDYVDFDGNLSNSGGGYSSGVRGGGGLVGSSCDGGMAIGEAFIPPNSSSTVTITSVSSVWSYGTNVGWIYLGSDGNRYAQANTAAEPPGVPAASGYLLYEFFGFAPLSHPDTSIAQMGAGQQLTHTAKSVKCHTSGSNLG